MRVFNKIKQYIDSEEPLEQKLLNIFLISAFIFSAFSVIVSFVLHADKTLIVVVSICIALIPVCYVLANDLKQPELSAIMTVILAIILFVPMFFYSGGLHCGMPVWYLMALILPWILVRGKKSLILFIIIFLVETASIIFSVYFPEYVHEIGDDLKIALDVIQSLFFIGSILSSIYVFQKFNYENQNTKLSDAYKEVKDATDAKSIFLSNMSHDIRTPMNAIVGFTELAAHHYDDPKLVEEYIEKIRQSSENMLAIINDVLDMSRFEGGKIVLEESECNIAELVKGVYDLMKDKANDKRLFFYLYTSGIASNMR